MSLGPVTGHQTESLARVSPSGAAYLGESEDAFVSSVMHKVGIVHGVSCISQSQPHPVGCVFVYGLLQGLEVACTQPSGISTVVEQSILLLLDL